MVLHGNLACSRIQCYAAPSLWKYWNDYQFYITYAVALFIWVRLIATAHYMKYEIIIIMGNCKKLINLYFY